MTISIPDKDELIYSHYSTNIVSVCQKLREKTDFERIANFYKSSADFHWNIKTLVRVLRRIYENGYTNQTTTTTVQGLRMLQQLIANSGEEKRASIQQELTKAGVALLVIEMCCASSHEIVAEGLDLGIALLDPGNREVQEDIYEIFQTNSSAISFLNALRERIRRAIEEIKDRRLFIRQKKERLEVFAELEKQKSLLEQMYGSTKTVRVAALDAQLVHKKEVLQEEFEEVGFIEKIMRLLQLFCEGHYLELQVFLNTQKEVAVPVNLVQECLNYTVQLAKNLDQDNMEIACQCYDTLTEFVQGPCNLNQRQLSSLENIFAANEILSNQYEGRVRFVDDLKLKYKVLLSLVSLVEGTEDVTSCINQLKTSLDISLLINNMRKCHEWLEDQKDTEISHRIKTDLANKELYVFEHETSTIHELVAKARKRVQKLGMQYFFLLNILSDHEKLLPKPMRVVTQHLATALEKKGLQLFVQEAGCVEIVRDNNIERAYFRIPDHCRLLTLETRRHFERSVSRESSHEKVETLFEKTSEFKIEMEHYDTGNAIMPGKLFSEAQQLWNRTKMGGFVLAIIINLIVLISFKKVANTIAGPVPIPGKTVLADIRSTLTADYSLFPVGYIVYALGILQLALSLVLLVTYVVLYSHLKVKKQFSIQIDESWKDVERGYRYYFAYVKLLFTDLYLWFLLGYSCAALLALFVSPLIYSIHLFEIVVHFSTLQNVLRAVMNSPKALGATGMLMLITIYFFSQLIFVFVYDEYRFKDGNDEHICDNALKCAASVLSYGLRSDSFWEDVFYGSLNWKRMLIDVGLLMVVLIVLVEVVFGIILDSFADLRTRKENNERLSLTKCFICDIDKDRFDAKANEGISFDRHVQVEHNMWNYVYFLIYVFHKDPTKFTGTEQYIHDQAKGKNLSFFPVLRSLVLEEAEHKEKVRLEAQKELEEKKESASG